MGFRHTTMGEVAADIAERGPNALLEKLAPGMKVHRAGMSFYGPGERSWPDREHRHEYPEIFLCLHGAGWFEAEDRRHPMRPGNIVLVDPWVEHHQAGGEGGLGTAWWLLEPK